MRNVDVTLLVNIPLTNPEGDCTEWKINVYCCWLLLPPLLLLLLVVVLQSNDDLLQHCPSPHPPVPLASVSSSRPVHGQSPARSSIHSFIRVLCALPHCDGCDPVNCIGFVQQVGALHQHHPFASALEIILIALTVCLSLHRTHLCSCSSWMVVLLLWG